MKFGICNLSVVPCRKEPSDKSEMVTQLLFGEHFEILDENDMWLNIRIAYDDYHCWIDKKQFQALDEKIVEKINTSGVYLAADKIQLLHNYEGAMFPIVIGSTLPFYSNKICLLGDKKFLYEGNVLKNLPAEPQGNLQRQISPNPSREKIIETAQLFLNAPYLWGGRTIFGLDCSGFTQLVFKLNGIKLKRDAHQQAEQGTTVNFADEAEQGDLAFFDNTNGKIVHVGIVASPPAPLHQEKGEKNAATIIHASGKVRIDSFDHQGIFNTEKKNYSHKLRVIKKLF